MKNCDICGVSSETKRISYFTRFQMCLCPKHYNQLIKYGKITDDSPKTMKDKNEYIEHKDFVEILAPNKKKNVTESILVDKSDFEEVRKYKWWLNIQPQRYNYTSVYGCINGKHIKLARFLLKYNGQNVVDHINGNPLDNRRSNLRIVTATRNKQNVRPRGVNLRKNNRWQVTFQRNKKQYCVGTYDTFEQAKKAREIAISIFDLTGQINIARTFATAVTAT